MAGARTQANAARWSTGQAFAYINVVIYFFAPSILGPAIGPPATGGPARPARRQVAANGGARRPPRAPQRRHQSLWTMAE